MRHRIKGRKLSRTAPHRKATLRALAMALIKSIHEVKNRGKIITTVAKAKELRGFIEPLITRAKSDTHHNRSQVFSKLQDKKTTSLLFDEIGPKAKDRPGGYTRVLKLGFRQGDGAEMAIIELVDYNDVKPEGSAGKRKRTRRAGKSNIPTSAEPKQKQEEQTADTADPEVKDETADAAEVKAEVAEKEKEKVEDDGGDAESEDVADEITDETSESEQPESEEDENTNGKK